MDHLDESPPEKGILPGSSESSSDAGTSLVVEETTPSCLEKSPVMSHDEPTSSTAPLSSDRSTPSVKPPASAPNNGPTTVLRKRLSTNFSALPIGFANHQSRSSISGFGVGSQGSSGAGPTTDTTNNGPGNQRDGMSGSGSYPSLGPNGPTRARRSLSQPFRTVSGSRILPQPISSTSTSNTTSTANSPSLSDSSYVNVNSANNSEMPSRSLSPVRATMAPSSSSSNILSQNTNVMDCLSELAVKERRVFEIKESISRLNEELASAERELSVYREEVSAVLSSHAMPPNNSNPNNATNAKSNNNESSVVSSSLDSAKSTESKSEADGLPETGEPDETAAASTTTNSSLYSLYPAASPERKPAAKHSRTASTANKFGFMTPMAVLDSLQSKLNAKDIKEALLPSGMNGKNSNSGGAFSSNNSARHGASLSNASTISAVSADGTLFEDIDEEANEEDEAHEEDAGNNSLIQSDDIINMGKRVAGELGSQFWGFVEDIRNVTVGEDIRDNSSRYTQTTTNGPNEVKTYKSIPHGGENKLSANDPATSSTTVPPADNSRRWKPKSQPQQVTTETKEDDQLGDNNQSSLNYKQHSPIINFDSFGI